MEGILKKKILFALLLTAILTLSSCSGGTENVAETQGSAVSGGVTEAQTSAESTLMPDKLFDGLGFNGQKIRIFYRGEIEEKDICGTANLGVQETDAVYSRNRSVEQRLNLKFEYLRGENEAAKNFEQIKEAVLSGSDGYDVIMTTGNVIVTYGYNNHMRNLNELEYVDFDQPWWWEYANAELSLDGKTRQYALGDIFLSSYNKLGSVYYNKSIYEAVHGSPDEPYEIVLDGKWTLAKLAELSKDAYSDLNGNQQVDIDDRIRLLFPASTNKAQFNALLGCDIKTYSRESDGRIKVAVDNPHMAEVFDALKNLWTNTAGSFKATSTSGVTEFARGNSLFLLGRLTDIYNDGGIIRAMEADYGILPYPKYSEAQENYVSSIDVSTTIVCILKSVKEDALTGIGAALEALASESYRSVSPRYIEYAMKAKYSRDELSGQVIDLMISTSSMDMLNIYSGPTNNIFGKIMSGLSKNQDFASLCETYVKTAQTMLDNYYDNLG